jgi:prepilin-type N-terminal cleavage/methylation domain-containing protein
VKTIDCQADERVFMRGGNRGFSLLEVLTVSTLVLIGSTVAVIQYRTSVAVLDADKASNLVVGQIRYARQVAVDQRRNVELAFVESNRITVTRQDGGGATTVMSDVTLPPGYTFGLAAGVGDTPEGYGDDEPVQFGLDDTSGIFQGDGAFVSGAAVVMNGTVFTIGSGNGSARAVTLTGASGRMKQYYIKDGAWVER